MSLNEKFNLVKSEMEIKNTKYLANSEAALMFVLNHFDTLRTYQKYRTRSQFRRHVIDLLDKEYGKGNYSNKDVLKVMDKNLYFSSPFYFFASLFFMGIADVCLNYMVDSHYMLIFNFIIIVVGTLFLTVILDMWKMKG